MPRQSAGLLMYRVREAMLEVLLAHPGGPLFAKKDEGHWTIPKGEYASGEDALAAGVREFEEETGLQPRGPYIPLGAITQKGGKIVTAWAFAAADDVDAGQMRSNTFHLEWPPKSGRMQEFPEVDRCEFFPISTAKRKIKATQIPLLEALERAVGN
jgi:predicted NUDIX family NTP pyrophosphohydrolase